MEAKEQMSMTDDMWLNVVRAELAESLGFQDNGTLKGQRADALKAYGGDVGITSIERRSSVNDTYLADAVATVIPDLMEIFTGGEDVATFEPVGPEDEDLAEQETDTVRQIFMEENDGYNNIYDYCWDALVLKTGILKVYKQERSEDVTESLTPPDGVGIQDFADTLQVMPDFEDARVEVDAERGVVDVTITKTRQCVTVETVPPEDFAVSEDTIALKDSPYCVHRTQVRAQDVLEQGYDAEKVKLLTFDNVDETVSDARDTVETEDDVEGSSPLEGMRRVTIYEHYVRILTVGGKMQIYQVKTDATCRVLLDVEEVDFIPFAAAGPFRRPHRFHDESLADKCLEVQRIKTSLWRLYLDSGYFAINQRYEIDATKLHKETLTKFQANRPGDLIPTIGGQAIRPLVGGGLAFDVLPALEAASVFGEEKTGVMRNAQGLNPDTLHDTAKGAQILISAAQKRVRQMARSLSQGIKDAYVLVHRLARDCGEEITLRRSGQYIPVDPSQWGFRQDAKIKIGVGSGGRDAKLAALMKTAELQERITQGQGGMNGPIVKAKHIHAVAEDIVKTAGLDERRYFDDPEQEPPQQPQPDPDVQKAQMDMRLEQWKAQQKAELEREVAQSKAELDRDKAQMEAELARYKAMLEASIAASKPDVSMPANRPGGRLDA